MFLSFAPELIQAIGEELDASDVKSMRLTCKQLGKVLGPLIRRKVTINLDQTTIERDMPKLRDFASEETGASQDTRDLNIQALSPTFHPQYNNHWGYNPPEVPAKALQAEAELELYLLDFMTSLKGVRKLRWSPVPMDNEWVQTMVVNALKNLPNLRVLELHLAHCKVPINLEELTGLLSLIVEDHREGEIYEQTLRSLPKMIANSPQLTSIELLPCLKWGESTPQTHSLHHLFRHYPRNTPPLRLLHLGLNGCFVRLDDTTIPHLLSLRSLLLIDLVNGYSGSDKDVEEQIEEVSRSADEFWDVLESIGIHLESIKHDSVTSSFLGYLSGYSRLKILDLKPDPLRIDSSISIPLATRLFTESLANHAQTLEELYIKPKCEGPWSLSLHSLTFISKCVNLKKLGMSIISAELVSAGGVEELASGNAIKRLIDMAVIHLPRLEALTIFSANLEPLRGDVWEFPAINHFYDTRLAMIDSVEKYTAPTSCHRLPGLTISPGLANEKKETYIGHREDRLWVSRLIYVSSKVVGLPLS